jgi:hypothetical protein
VESGRGDIPVPPKAVNLLFYRTKRGDVAVARLGVLLAGLLDLAAGQLPLSQIVKITAEQFDAEISIQDAWRVLAPLGAEGIIGFN